MPDWLYITKARALESQLTHEGTLFGVPAYFAGDEDGEIAMATPKVPALHAWCMIADLFYAAAAYVMPADAVVHSPIRIGAKIKP